MLWVGLWCGCVLGPVAGSMVYAQLWSKTPPLPNILAHESANADQQRAFSSEGILLGRGEDPRRRALRREWASYEEIPPLVVGAFLAAEDNAFFEHRGVNSLAILRAAYVNLRRRGVRQGGSTITQQLAKMYVGDERSLTRKIKEALLARQIERSYSKAAIIEAYLNRIYLGAGAYGIVAAGRRYFDAELAELTVAEAALIAGLTIAPSVRNPYRNKKSARYRRHDVLAAMLELGVIDEVAFAQADRSPVVLRPAGRGAPAQGSALRDEVRRRSTSEGLEGAVEVEVTVSLALQRLGEAALREGASQIAAERGDEASIFNTRGVGRRSIAVEDPVLWSGRRYVGEVSRVTTNAVTIRVGWARLSASSSAHPWLLDDRGKWRLSVGGLVRVSPARSMLTWGRGVATVHPWSEVQGALSAIDVESGGIRALVGGVDEERSQFNRATQSCRQPGSVFKPLLYALALREGLTTSSMLYDTPLHIEDDRGHLVWAPRNADRRWKGPITLDQALASSRNLPAVQLLRRLGVSNLIGLARSLGLRTSPLAANDTLALGSSCVQPLEMTAAYGAFIRRGVVLEPHLVRSAIGREGVLLFDRGHPADPAGPLEAQLLRALNDTRGERRALSKAIAYLTTYLLRQVVERGTARGARLEGLPLAGKTGTTSLFDVWFVGFSEDLLAGVWLGEELNHTPLGDRVSAGRFALPPWVAFMKPALSGRTQRDPLETPPSDVVYQRIDPQTGVLAHPEGPGRRLPFVKGSEPRDVAPSPLERQSQDAERLERDF